MSITSPDDRVATYNPVVATTEFAADFPVFNNTDLTVYVNDVERADFTVTATYVDGISNDAKAVFNPGITGKVQVVGARDPRRSNRFTDGAPLPTRDQNLALDTIEAEMQEIRRDVDRAAKSAIGVSGALLTLGAAGQVPMWDAEGNLIPASPQGTGDMNTAAYDPDLVHAAALSRIPVQPEAFGALADGVANDNAAILSAANFAVARNRPLLLTDGKTYLFQKLTLPANLIITGNGVLRSNAALTVAADVTLTLGSNTIAEAIRFSTPGTETNTDIISIGANCRIGYLDVRSDAQRAGGGVITTADNVYIGRMVSRKIDRPLDLNNQSTTTQTRGTYIGFLDVEDYVRAFRAVFCSFTLGGMRAKGRSANASKSAGHNGFLISGCADWAMGDLWIEDAGEHAGRIGGSEVSAASTAITKNYTIGIITAVRCGGCAFKINPTRLVSAGVTEKAYNGSVKGVIGIDVGDAADSGNEELLRLTHVRGLTIGFAHSYIDTDAVSSQYLLQVNDINGVTIGELGGDNVAAGFLNIDGTSDVDGVATFGGDVLALRIDRMFGVTAGNNAIGVNTAFNIGRVRIGLDGIRGFATNLVSWSGGTLTDVFALSGRVTGAVAPAFASTPSNDNFLVDISYGNTTTVGRGTSARFGISSILQLVTAAFDPSNVVPNGLMLNATQATGGVDTYGSAIEFSRVGSGRRGAAIAVRQTGSNAFDTGLEFSTGGTTTATDAVNAALRLHHTKALQIPDGITAPATVTGWASIYVDTVDGDLKIKFGDGTTKTIVVDT